MSNASQRIKSLQGQIEYLRELTSKLTNDKDTIVRNIDMLEDQLKVEQKRIESDSSISQKKLDRHYNCLNKAIQSIKQQISEQQIKDEMTIKREKSTDLERVDKLEEENSNSRKQIEKECQEPCPEYNKKPPKYDFSRWRYAELRDALNTPTGDDEFMKECKEEMDRRLEVTR